jgi:hypothetical protein
MYYIGIDNGVSGAVGVVADDPEFSPMLIITPTFTQQNYTKKSKNITRIDTNKLRVILEPYSKDSIILLERPMVNPKRFNATRTALRAHEATLIVIESLGIPIKYVDSKEWQKSMLPKNTKPGTLKISSLVAAMKLFPHLNPIIKKQKDGDAILIAEYLKKTSDFFLKML